MTTPEPLDLEAIKARIKDCLTYNFGLRNADRLAHEDAPALVAEVERLRSLLGEVEVYAVKASETSWGGDYGNGQAMTGESVLDILREGGWEVVPHE